MATLTITLSAAASNEVTDAFGAGYQATIDGQPNPETKAQYARRQIIAMLKRHVINYRERLAAAAAAQGVDPDIT